MPIKKTSVELDQDIKDAMEMRIKKANEAQTMFQQEKVQQSEEKVRDSSDALVSLQQEVDDLKQKFKDMNSRNGTLSKKEIDSIVHDINVTLATIGKIDSEIKDLLDKREAFFLAIDQCEVKNRFDEMKNLNHLMHTRNFEVHHRTHTIHVSLRNEIEQLQSKIRSFDTD